MSASLPAGFLNSPGAGAQLLTYGKMVNTKASAAVSAGLLCRWALEQTNPNLGPWVSALDEQFDEEAIAQEADQVAARAAALEAEMARDAAAAR